PPSPPSAVIRTQETRMPSVTRRSFLTETAAAGLGLTASLGVLSGRDVAANEKIGVACIGVRGQGGALLRTFAAQQHVAITHICDIDESVRQKAGHEIKEKTSHAPKLVNDYRTILDEKGVDVFVIGTPDHWHALPAVHGCMAGKDVYVEKPDGHNILEGKA